MNAEDVADHAQCVAYRTDFAIRVEVPLDGDFLNAQFFAAGKEEQLDIERPAGERLLSKEGCGRFGAKTFEAALRVVQARQDQGADGEVDGAPANMAIRRLVVADRPRRFARTDGDIKIIEDGRQEFGQVFDRHRKIGVADEAVFAACR